MSLLTTNTAVGSHWSKAANLFPLPMWETPNDDSKSHLIAQLRCISLGNCWSRTLNRWHLLRSGFKRNFSGPATLQAAQNTTEQNFSHQWHYETGLCWGGMEPEMDSFDTSVPKIQQKVQHKMAILNFQNNKYSPSFYLLTMTVWNLHEDTFRIGCHL